MNYYCGGCGLAYWDDSDQPCRKCGNSDGLIQLEWDDDTEDENE